MKVTIEGHGEFQIRIPKNPTRKEIKDLIGEAVAETMSLIDPRDQYFHPVLGVIEIRKEQNAAQAQTEAPQSGGHL